MKAARKDLAITTDVIVGYPGETEEDYLMTKETMRDIGFDNAFIFRYSQRRNTPAAEMEDQIAEVIKEQRNQDLLAMVNQIAIDKNELQVGTTQEVLCTGGSKKDPNRLTSRTSQNKIVIFDGNAERMTGKILPIKIERSSGFTLFGTPVIH
jgi:tRNA-2-methylthio-N6-dimethylallyladenosine synthase